MLGIALVLTTGIARLRTFPLGLALTVGSFNLNLASSFFSLGFLSDSESEEMTIASESLKAGLLPCHRSLLSKFGWTLDLSESLRERCFLGSCVDNRAHTELCSS